MSVRDRSERYGSQWCTSHALTIAAAIKAFKKCETELAVQIPVRVYDRSVNSMRDVTLADLLVHFQNMPEDTKANGAGQICIREDMNVSNTIFMMIRAVWSAV